MLRIAHRTMVIFPLFMVLAALMISAVPASANTIIGIIDWEPPPGTAWTADDPDAAVSIDASGGNQWLRISFTNTVPPGVLVSGSAADLFAGTWSSEYWIEFDFWADMTVDGSDGSNIGLGDPNVFLADLSSIDWIGVYIDWAGTGDESYGIDDVSLMVPEPAEIMMLAAAFGVAVLVWRRMRLVPVVG